MTTDYARKRAQQQVLKSAINKVTPSLISYDLKQPFVADFYEGEYPVDFDALAALKPWRVAFQVTCGRHGRHGDDKPDRAVARYIQESKQRGLAYWLYHLLTLNNISEQATFYLRSVDQLGGFAGQPAMVDVEQYAGELQGKDWAGQVKAFLDIAEGASDRKPVLYSSLENLREIYTRQTLFVNGRRVDQLKPPAWLRDYPLFLAWYPWKPYIQANQFIPRQFVPEGCDCAVWQYEEHGRPRFPANDISVVSPWFVAELENGQHG